MYSYDLILAHEQIGRSTLSQNYDLIRDSVRLQYKIHSTLYDCIVHNITVEKYH